MYQNRFTVEPLLRGHPFCTRNKAFLEGCPPVRGRNQYIYAKIYIVIWPLQRRWPLIRMASQERFLCILCFCQCIKIDLHVLSSNKKLKHNLFILVWPTTSCCM